MRRLFILSISILGVLAFFSCEKAEYGAPDKSKYIYDIPQTSLPSPATVGAYYTNYTSAVSDAKSPEVPELGYYKTTDEGVLRQHITWADEAALDFLIFTWNGSSSDNALLQAFSQARADGGNVKYVLCYNTSHLNLTNDAPLKRNSEKYKAFLADFADVLGEQMLSDAYFRLDGKPVILFTPTNLGSDALLSIDFQSTMEAFREDMQSFFGVDVFIIGQNTTGWVAPVNYADHQVYSFDAVVLREWKTRSYDLFYGFFSFLDINWNNWKTTLAKRNVDFVPCVYPSYNDRKNSSSSYYYTFGDEGKTTDYINFCNVAKRNIGSHNLVLVNSWNDWVNGTNLEPSDLKQERFLAETRGQFK